MDMELRRLRYFIAVAEELHFGRAAQRLHITQPPLSFIIRQLEDQLGVRLFERDRTAVTLTSAGRTLLAEARNLLERSAHAKSVAKAAAKGRARWLTIGFSGSMTYAGVPQLVAAYGRRYPDVELRLTESSRFRQFAGLADGRIQAGFVDIVRLPVGMDGLLLCEDDFVCCLPDGHRLLSRRSIDVIELSDDDFVMFTHDSESANYNRIMSICIDAGFEPRIGSAVQQWLSVIALVAGGLGVAIVPARIARAGIAGVQFIPITTASPARSYGHLVWNPKRLTPELSRFVELTRSIAESPKAGRTRLEALA